LVLAPHPDDEVFGCGGALARHVELGAAVTVLIFTDGAFGAAGDEAQTLREQRRAESCAAARALGYGTPCFLGLPDRGLCYGEALISTVQGWIEATQADLVYAPSLYEMHPDHRILAMTAQEALRRAGGEGRLAFYEVGVPLQRPTHLVDITPFLLRKTEAMACFASQLSRQSYDQHIGALNRFRTYTLPSTIVAAEAFAVVEARTLARDPLGLYRSEYQQQHSLGLPLQRADLPLVSVLIRSMDRDSLSQALDSVALQTYSNIEVVVVNASGRPHRELGPCCGAFPLRLIDPGLPLNRSAAANAALDAARGELLIFLDDDDWYLPGHINTLKTALDGAAARTIAAYDGVSCVDARGKEVRRYQRAFDKFDFSMENFIPIHAILFRRKALERGARFDEQQLYCEDWDFWLQVQDHGDFHFVPELGAIYRLETGEGSGLWGNSDLARSAMGRIYHKRLPLWSDEQLAEVFWFTRYKPLYEETAQELARERQKLHELSVESNTQIAQRDTLIAQREAQIEQGEAHVAALEAYITLITQSASWKITAPLRKIMVFLRGEK
jgi:LmbE family N-acetylglucosaminyl deacetylase